MRLWREGGLVEPIPPIGLAMYAKRSADGVAEFAVVDPLLAREDLDAIFESAAFDRHAETQSEVVDIDATLGG